MANTQHLKQSSKFKLPKNKEEIGFPFEELRKNDYPVLSKALVKKGSLKLLSGDNSGLEFFDMALKIDSSNPRTYIDQSLSLFWRKQTTWEGLSLFWQWIIQNIQKRAL